MNGLLIMLFAFICWIIYVVLDGMLLSTSPNRWDLRVIVYMICIGLKGYSLIYNYFIFNAFELTAIVGSVMLAPIFVFPFINFVGSGGKTTIKLTLFTRSLWLIVGVLLVMFQIYVVLIKE